MSALWSIEQVEAVAPSAAAVTAARQIAAPTRWSGLGADDRCLWGSFQGSGAEPYDTAVDHVGVRFRCTCPSRKTPCKHAIALLLLWVAEQVPIGVPSPSVGSWIAAHRSALARTADSDADPVDERSTAESDDAGADAPSGDRGPDRLPDRDLPPDPPPDPAPPDRDRARDERVERMFAGLTELDRWLDDRIRTGLADPALAQYSTWDDLAARLVDAQAGSLANRVRRLAGLVGASPDWHDDVLAELGLLHLLAQAGRRLGSLPGPLADAVATTVGWQVRQADVLASVPDTDHWVVAGRSDRREDRIEVRRHWLRGTVSGRWALVLSFAADGQSLDTSLVVGTTVHADLHRYPGPALRALIGMRHPDPVDQIFPTEVDEIFPTEVDEIFPTEVDEIFPTGASVHAAGNARTGRPPARSIIEGCNEIGRMLVAEPWLDRLPTTVTASLTRRGGSWFLTDATGSLPLLDTSGNSLAMLLALSQGRAVDLTVEWTPAGVTPIAVHLDDRSVDVGPRADASFVGAA